MREEALVVCGEKKKSGITIWDLENGNVLRRIPTCASPPHGLLCLHNNRILVASQLQKDRPFGCGSIFFRPLNKAHAPPQISYPMEAVGSIASSKNGAYLVGGTHLGNAYIWEVASGRLLKNWRAHQRSLSCLALSPDDSFLITGSDDGTVCIWSLISLLDTEDPQNVGIPPSFRRWSEHRSSVTGLVPVSGVSGPALVSGSLDGTCKVWDIVTGRLVQNHVFSVAVTAVGIDPTEQLLFAGRRDGKIHANALHLGLQEDQITVSEDESGVLNGHKGPITALVFNSAGSMLISASEDCSVCVWDAASWQIIRRLAHGNGHVTNMIVIPKSSLSEADSHRSRLRPRISSLQKTTQPGNAAAGARTLLPANCSAEHCPMPTNSLSSSLLNKQIADSEQGIEMKIGSGIENRLWILNMTKHMNSINQHLRSRVMDMMRCRLCGEDTAAASPRKGGAEMDDDLHES